MLIDILLVFFNIYTQKLAWTLIKLNNR